jgi:hypothetical protein
MVGKSWWRAFSEERADELLKLPGLLCTAFINA